MFKLYKWLNTWANRDFRNLTNKNWDIIEKACNSLQTQMNTIVANGDSGPEAKQARVDQNGQVYSTLKERIDAEQIKIGDMVSLGPEYRDIITTLSERELNIRDFGAKGDGETDDTKAFNEVESLYQGAVVELLGGIYKVSTLPIKNIYKNGTFYFNDSYIPSPYHDTFKTDNAVIAIGVDAAKLAPNFPIREGEKFYKNIAIGGSAMGNSRASYNNIALGWGTMNFAESGEHFNIAIGNESLFHMNKPKGNTDKFAASRNSAIGSNSMRFNEYGYQNSAIGRNSLQCNVNGIRNTALGNNALSGYAPVDLEGNIVNLTKHSSNDITAVGFQTLFNNVVGGNTAVGSWAATNVVNAENIVAVGRDALKNLQRDVTAEGYLKVELKKTGLYTWSGTAITVTIDSHGLKDGYLVSLALITGDVKSQEDLYYVISNVTNNTFTISTSISNNTTGVVRVSWYSTQEKHQGLSENNTAIGTFAMENIVTGENNVSVGTWSLRNVNGNKNTAVGSLAGLNLISGDNNTAIGYSALRYHIDDSDLKNVSNSTAIGYNSKVSGSNQVQLGNHETNTYVYGTVQNRSDERDKADIRDTILGLDFINKLRPVDFKWNYRESYIDRDKEGNRIDLPSDGSNKGTRYHHGVIAQHVKEVMDSMGVEFGGWQDHSLEDGADVMSIGYDEFIGPLIKAIQELTLRVQNLEKQQEASN